MIRWLVGQVRVSASSVEVCRYVIRRMKPGVFAALPRTERRDILSAIICEHQKNRAFYEEVMLKLRG